MLGKRYAAIKAVDLFAVTSQLAHATPPGVALWVFAMVVPQIVVSFDRKITLYVLSILGGVERWSRTHLSL